MMILFEKLSRLILLARCLLTFLFRGKAKTIPRNPSSVIVVLTGKLGDIVCGTPVLRAIRARLPRARVVAAGAEGLLRPILSDSGLVDDYLNLEEKGALSRIKEYRAEAALVTGPSLAPVALLYLSGIPLVVAPEVEGGFSPAETRPYKILRRLIETFPYRMGEYAPRERLRVLEPLGIFSDDTKKLLGFSEAADKKINQFFAQNRIGVKKDFVVGISPSAGNKIKEWPEERFAEVADYLIKKHQAKVVLIGGPDDKEKVGEVIKNVKNPENIINTQGEFNIDELKAFVSKLSLFISVDTGPIYIAEVFNVPTIDITGPINEMEQPPISKIHKVVTPVYRKKPELFVMNARDYNKIEARRQIESITVDMVIDIFEELYPFIKKQHE